MDEHDHPANDLFPEPTVGEDIFIAVASFILAGCILYCAWYALQFLAFKYGWTI